MLQFLTAINFCGLINFHDLTNTIGYKKNRVHVHEEETRRDDGCLRVLLRTSSGTKPGLGRCSRADVAPGRVGIVSALSTTAATYTSLLRHSTVN